MAERWGYDRLNLEINIAVYELLGNMLPPIALQSIILKKPELCGGSFGEFSHIRGFLLSLRTQNHVLLM